MTLRDAMGWIALAFGGLMIAVLVWGIFSPTLPTSTALWPIVVVAAGVGIKYVFGANKLGLFVTILGVVAFLAFSVFGVERYLPGGTDRTSLTPGATPPAASTPPAAPAVAPAATPPASAPTPPPAPSASGDPVAEWLTWGGSLIGAYWLAALAALFLLGLFGTILWFGLKKLYSSGGSWFTTWFTILALAVGFLAAADYFLSSGRHTAALWQGVVAGWNSATIPGSSGAGGASSRPTHQVDLRSVTTRFVTVHHDTHDLLVERPRGAGIRWVPCWPPGVTRPAAFTGIPAYDSARRGFHYSVEDTPDTSLLRMRDDVRDGLRTARASLRIQITRDPRVTLDCRE